MLRSAGDSYPGRLCTPALIRWQSTRHLVAECTSSGKINATGFTSMSIFPVNSGISYLCLFVWKIVII